MNKYLKYILYGLIYLVIIFVFAIMFIVTTQAEVIKPNNGIEPYQVVKIQLRSLKNNDDPFENAGIEQTWEFAHPNNKKYTGPLERFKTMLSSDSYKMLLNHIDHNIIEVKITDFSAAYEVTILGKGKNYYKFKWMVEKFNSDGPLKDCWLTTAVSQPVSLGSSI
tara:strand:+ start:1370 stop:1864 length:495 start_codon:yes stop_codon:yes gene_type:complete